MLSDLYSQTNLSSNFYENGSWDKDKQEWSFYFVNNKDTTIFEIDEEQMKIIRTIGDIITSYKINNIEKEDDNTTIYDVTCETCNDFHKKTVEKVTIIVALKKDFFGIYSDIKTNSHSSKSLTRYLINKPNEEEEKLKKGIYDQYLIERSKCWQDVKAITDFNGKTEFWRICETNSENRIIQINSYDKYDINEEVYFEKNGELIYAMESSKWSNQINHYITDYITTHFYTEKGEILSSEELGNHYTKADAGDDWNPDIIFEMYKKRIAELNKIEK
jgi:hypothetical protein